MKRTIAFLAAALALSSQVGPALAAPGGQIGTMPQGFYACELPGDASGPVGVRAPDADFTIDNASSYSTATGRGTYLLTGDRLAMTSGPQAGTVYRRQSGGFVRKLLPDGTDSSLRCILGVSNNSR